MHITQYEVPLSIDREEYLHSYSGHAKVVVARDVHGKRLQFPALALRPFVSHSGIQGTFIISVDVDNRLVDIRRKAC